MSAVYEKITLPHWCRCQQCCRVPKEDDRVCCDEEPCITSTDTFDRFIETLTTEKLQSSDPDIQSIKEKVGSPIFESLSPNGQLRRLAYELTEAKYFCNGSSEAREDSPGRKSYPPLPSCVRNKIKRKFPESGGEYTGYPPNRELLQKVIEAHEKFKKKMKLHNAAVRLTDPDRVRMFSSLEGESLEIPAEDLADEIKKNDLMRQITETYPTMACVFCTGSFETFIFDTVRRCVDVAYHPRTADQNNFQQWLNNRLGLAERWSTDVEESEVQFWKKYLPEYNEISKLDNARKILEYIKSQKGESVREKILQKLQSDMPTDNHGQACSTCLNQLVLDEQKRIIRKELIPTMDCVANAFLTMLKSCQTNEQLPSTPKRPKVNQSCQTDPDSKGIVCLVSHFASKNTWDLYLTSKVVKLTSTDDSEKAYEAYKGLCHISDLFYGIRCIVCHGSPQKTVQSGVMSHVNAPKKKKDFGISVKETQASEDECSQYLMDRWNEAVTKMKSMSVDRNLFRSMLSFYSYMVEIIGMVGACLVYHLSDKLMKEKIKEVVGKSTDEIKEALTKAWPEKYSAAPKKSKLSESTPTTSTQLDGRDTGCSSSSRL